MNGLSAQEWESYTGSAGEPTSSMDITNNTQEPSDTQRSLQQASVALEVAYNRIRQVRRSLLQLSDSLPIPDNLPRFSTNYNEVRPGHEALLLSGDSGNNSVAAIEMDRDTRNLVRLLTSVPPSPPVGTNTSSIDHATQSTNPQGDNEGPLQSNEFDPLLFEPISPPNVLPPRFSRRELLSSDLQYFTRRGINEHSAATLHGLRVAAREAHGREERDQLSAQPAEQVRVSRGQLDSRDSVLHGREERQMRSARSIEERRAGGLSTPLTAPTMASWRVPDPRRWRTRLDGRATLRSSNSDTPDRHASNTFDFSAFSPQFPRNTPRLPLLAEADATFSPYEQSRSVGTVRPDDDAPSNVAINWSDEEFISWLFHAPGQHPTVSPSRQSLRNSVQSNPDVVRITRTTDTAVSAPEILPPRRGWARLDPDGNEIPASEEEELERSRTAYRLQALQRSRHNAAGQTLTHATNTQRDGEQRHMHGNVLDPTLSIQGNGFQRHSSEDDFSPLYIDPLPMPLSSMALNSEKRNQIECHDTFVPQNAALAGR